MVHRGISPAGASCLLPRDGKGIGLRHGLAVRRGLSLARTDVRYDIDTNFRFLSPGNQLKLHFKLAGTCEISDDSTDFLPVEAGRVSMLIQPPDSFKRERVSVNELDRSVTLICDQEFSADLISRQADLSQDVQDFLRGRAPRFYFASMPMPLQMRPIVEDILDPTLDGALGDLLLQAKALELLCNAVHQILKAPESQDSVRERDRRKVLEICAYFGENPASAVGNAELSRSVAWNETQMMRCFKAVTGMTISDYRQRLRMDNARRELRETDASVTEIAFNAGYEHPSNFATAFKRAFGVSPKFARRVN